MGVGGRHVVPPPPPPSTRKHTSDNRAPKWDTIHATPRTQFKGDNALNPVDAAQPDSYPIQGGGKERTAKHCPRDTNNHGTELAMKAVRQARLELSGGSTPDQLKPPRGCAVRKGTPRHCEEDPPLGGRQSTPSTSIGRPSGDGEGRHWAVAVTQ